MKIVPNQVFLHDRVRYEEGQEYDVSYEDGCYFVNVGWADTDEDVDPNITQAPAEDLEVHDSTLGQEN